MAAYVVQKPAEPRQELAHKLELDERRHLTLSGVTEVVSFDENTVVLKTVKGVLLVRGEKLQLQTLSLDGGKVAVEGSIRSMSYEELRKEGGFFRRLLG